MTELAINTLPAKKAKHHTVESDAPRRKGGFRPENFKDGIPASMLQLTVSVGMIHAREDHGQTWSASLRQLSSSDFTHCSNGLHWLKGALQVSKRVRDLQHRLELGRHGPPSIFGRCGGYQLPAHGVPSDPQQEAPVLSETSWTAVASRHSMKTAASSASQLLTEATGAAASALPCPWQAGDADYAYMKPLPRAGPCARSKDSQPRIAKPGDAFSSVVFFGFKMLSCPRAVPSPRCRNNVLVAIPLQAHCVSTTTHPKHRFPRCQNSLLKGWLFQSVFSE